jgi:hypothetical protein
MGIIVHIRGKFEQPAHGLPADADEWDSVIGNDG